MCSSDLVLEQVHDVAVKGDGSDLPLAHQIMSPAERLLGRLRDLLDPALTVPRRDTRGVHLGRDGDAATYDAVRFNGQPRRALDVSRAEKAFGFRATTDFKTGLRETIRYYVENRDMILAKG